MRLWHQDLIEHLPDRKTSGVPELNQLGGQHRECCAMRGGGWDMKHSTVDYVWKHSKDLLEAYHMLVIIELEKRGFNIDPKWYQVTPEAFNLFEEAINGKTLYPEHDREYFDDCLDNLRGKGIILCLNDNK